MKSRLPGWRVSALTRAGLVAVLVALAAPTHGRPIATATEPVLIYIPLISDATPDVANPSFEDNTFLDWAATPPCWYSYPNHDTIEGNQMPGGWTYFSPAAGVPLPFPKKMQQGQEIDAISEGPGEYVHKGWCQLPEHERAGWPEAIIVQGSWVYKAFKNGGPHALILSQVLTATVGTRVQVAGYILGETHDSPTSPTGELEDDHFVAAVRLGDADNPQSYVEDKRLYVTMKDRRELENNNRAWNRFEVMATVPAGGRLLLQVIVQQNWIGITDFFIDHFSAETILSP